MNCEKGKNTGKVCEASCQECGTDSTKSSSAPPAMAGWTSTKERTPSIVPYDEDTECGASDEVLTAYVYRDEQGLVSEIVYGVDRLYRGGRGNCESVQWGCGETPDYWKPIVGPFHIG